MLSRVNAPCSYTADPRQRPIQARHNARPLAKGMPSSTQRCKAIGSKYGPLVHGPYTFLGVYNKYRYMAKAASV